MAIDFRTEINIDTIQDELSNSRGVTVGLLRLDQIHAVVSGNKWFKLKYNLEAAQQLSCQGLLTFGGAYSNHLIATAAAAAACNMTSIGIIRGLHAKNNLTPTLESCRDYGMSLHFISRTEYNLKETDDFLNKIQSTFPGYYIIPEGGDNQSGRKGTEEIAGLIPKNTTHVVLAVGSGATFSGLRNGLPDTISMMGITAMKNGQYMKEELASTIHEDKKNWSLFTDYHWGGFAKCKPELIAFMNTFFAKHQIPLDMVYNAKMMWAVSDLINQNYFPKGSKILCVHTGGLQGNISIREQLCFNSIS